MGTRYKSLVALDGAAAMAPGEVRAVANPILRVPDEIFINTVEGDLTLDLSLITATSITYTNPGSMENQSRVWLIYNHSVPK
jgi:hypothetical protein